MAINLGVVDKPKKIKSWGGGGSSPCPPPPPPWRRHCLHVLTGTKPLKVPRNPNACWLPLIRSDVYTTYRLTLGYKCVSYFIIYFFNNFCQMCYMYAPPPKKNPSKLRFLRWHHLSIISRLAYLEQKTGMSLPINWQPVHNSIAFAYNGSSQTCIHN